MYGGLYNSGSFNAAGQSFRIASTLFEAIRSYLLLTVPMVTEIYNRKPKPGAVFPYLIISKINSTQELNTGPSYEDVPEFQFVVLANDDETAETIGLAAFNALMPNSTNPRLVWQDGSETVRLPMFKDRLIEQPGRDKLNRNVWAYIFGYKILTARDR